MRESILDVLADIYPRDTDSARKWRDWVAATPDAAQHVARMCESASAYESLRKMQAFKREVCGR